MKESHQAINRAGELNVATLNGLLKAADYAPDEIPINPEAFLMLSHEPVAIKGENYELVYKITKPAKNMLSTRLSLIDKALFENPEFQESLVKRQTIAPYNPVSHYDYTMRYGEAAFLYFNIDLSRDMIETRSKLEVAEALRGQGIGSFFFRQYEMLAKDVVGRIPSARGDAVRLIVRDNSEPKGWTSSMAEKGGYGRVPKNESRSSFATFQKIITVE